MSLSFGVLGPLAARLDGTELNLGPAKQRSFLLALLLEPNRVVSINRLLDLLWDGDPPPSAVANVRTYAYRLRRTLGDPRGQRLVGRPPGYLIRVEPQELDLLRYEELVEQAQAAMASGNHAAAATGFRHALDLWEGDAAEDLRRNTSLESRLVALDEQRLTVVEKWSEAQLELGEHGDVVNVLRRQLEQHPLRERLWCQLMLAMYRSGDIVAALAAYRDARRILARELAVEPGPQLRQCHAAVLARDPDLSACLPSKGGERPPSLRVPHELPIGLPSLVGRDRELAAIRSAARRDGPVIVGINGAAGVGKSALAIHVAHQLKDGYPDGQIYVDLQEWKASTAAQQPSEILAGLLRMLGGDTAAEVRDCRAAAARFRTMLAGRSMLIVLDNVTDDEQVRQLLPGAPGVLVLITSRRMLVGLDCTLHLRVDPLSPEAGSAVLRQWCGTARADDSADLKRVVAFCDGMPLALRIIGAQLAARPNRSLAATAEELADESARLDLLALGHTTVRSSLAASYERLTDSARRLLCLLSRVRVPTITPSLAAAVVDQPTAVVERTLDELAGLHLISTVGTMHYRMSELVRLYATEQGDQDPAGDTLRRALIHYLRETRRVFGAQTLDLSSAARWLTFERSNVLALIRQVDIERPHLLRYTAPLQAAVMFDDRQQAERGLSCESTPHAAGRPENQPAEVPSRGPLGRAALIPVASLHVPATGGSSDGQPCTARPDRWGNDARAITSRQSGSLNEMRW